MATMNETPCFDRPETHVEPLWGINAEMKADLDHYVGKETRLDRDPSAPMLFSLWADDDLIGAGRTINRALRDALRTARSWSK
jgi:hypothetical protein